MPTAGDPDAGQQPVLTVAAVARRLGVASSTLRTWDRRYGIGPSAHTAGSHRRYGPADLARLVVMRRLTAEGVPPADAARIALGTGGAGAPLLRDAPVTSVEPPVRGFAVDLAGGVNRADLVGGAVPGLGGTPVLGIPAARTGPDSPGPLWPIPLDRGQQAGPAPHCGDPAEHRPPRHGGGRVVALPAGSSRARGLARAAMALDAPLVIRLLQDEIHACGTVRAWDDLALPVLRALGERWTQTGDGVEVEHAFSEAVLGVLHGVSGSLRRARNVRPVLLTCAENDHHTLPLHALAAALAEQGIGCRVLGVGMPAKALVAAVRRCGPAAVFVYARMGTQDVDVLESIPRQRPAPRLFVGGPGWPQTELPAPAIRVDSLAAAVDGVLHAVQF